MGCHTKQSSLQLAIQRHCVASCKENCLVWHPMTWLKKIALRAHAWRSANGWSSYDISPQAECWQLRTYYRSRKTGKHCYTDKTYRKSIWALFRTLHPTPVTNNPYPPVLKTDVWRVQVTPTCDRIRINRTSYPDHTPSTIERSKHEPAGAPVTQPSMRVSIRGHSR